MIEKKAGIVIYHYPNREIRSFLNIPEISKYRVDRFTNPCGETFDAQLKELGTIGAYVVREILAIPGVREVEIKPRELWVKKEAVVSWDRIENRVVNILNTAFRRKEIRLV